MSKKTVLITGTSSGIGLKTAVYLAQRGFQVYATMRDLSRRDALDAEAKRCDVEIKVLQCDVTDEVSINNAVGTVVAHEGRIYGLVNNAGILIQGFFEDITDGEMRQAVETNIFGTMTVTRKVLPYMRAAGCGRIIIISSTGGRITLPGVSAYCISKFALEGFAESLVQEIIPFGVRVVLVEPGIIATELLGRNRNIAPKALNHQSIYYPWFKQLEKETDDELKRVSTSPVDVAKSVHKALTATRPKLRYVVGRRAKVLMALRRRLPGEVFDRFWMAIIKRRIPVSLYEK